MTSPWGSCQKDVAALLKAVSSQGAMITKHHGHIKVKGGNGRGMVSVNCSSVSTKTILDIRADLRRAGYVL